MKIPNLIILTGFMGTGKTAVGQALARVLHYRFVDSDREIASSLGKSIPKIFEEHGEAYFRELETATIKRLILEPKRVLSVGGGALLKNFELLDQAGKMILLKASPDEIARRLEQEQDRPLLAGPNRKKRILELIAEREPVYNRVDLQIDTTKLAVDQVVQKILDVFL